MERILALLTEANELAGSLNTDNPALRAQCIQQSQALTRTLQGPLATLQQIYHAHYHSACLRTALEAGWLQAITSAGPAGLHVSSIKNGELSVIRQILRLLASHGTLRETAIDTFAPTPTITFLTEHSGVAAGLIHTSHAYAHAASVLPQYLAANGCSFPPSVQETPYALSQGCGWWEKLARGGRDAEAFNFYMAALGTGRKEWFEMYPVEEKLGGDEAMIVDVGGNQGHEIAGLAKRKEEFGLPQGKFVLQDLPKVLEIVPPESRDLLELCPHDFFQSQPAQYHHAKAYYMRFVLHDWDDSHCLTILNHIRDAMKPGYSKLLINELVLPDQGCSELAASLDLAMMSIVAGRERTKREWEELIGRVEGLRVEGWWRLEEGVGYCVIEVGREG